MSFLDDIEYIKRNKPFVFNDTFITELFPKFQMDVYESTNNVECVLSTSFDDKVFYQIYNLSKFERKLLTNKQIDDLIIKMKSNINVSIGYLIKEKLNKEK